MKHSVTITLNHIALTAAAGDEPKRKRTDEETAQN
jgi:hypothetical protein